MRKNSIITTVLIALLAVLMFVGCEQSAPFKYVVSASVTSEDFLAGQAFDPNKITVTVNYSDGKSSTLTGVGTAANLKDGKVAINSTVTVSAGLDVQGDEYEKTIVLPVYEATGLKVTAPASVTVKGQTDEESVDASLFTVSATYKNGEIALLPNVDYTVTVDAQKLVANQAATVTATITSNVFDDVTAEVSATYSKAEEPAPTYDYESFTWEQNQLAFSVADVNAFEREEFDPDNITLYRIYKNGQVGSGYYLVPVDNADVTYGFADGVAAEAEQYPAYAASTGETATIYFDYAYIAEDETTGLLSHIDEGKLLFEVDPADFTADAEGRLIPNTVAGSYDTSSTDIVINIRPDYVTAITAEVTEDKGALYVGETVQSLWLDVTATYASGYEAEGGNKLGTSDFEVTPNTALKLGDKISVKVTDTYGDNAALYGKSATFDTDLQVLDYIVSFKATLKSSVTTPVYSGQVLGPESFDFSEFVMASDPEKKVAAPAGVEYEMYNTLIPSTDIAGGYGNFWINAKFNGKTVMSNAVTVAAVADQPASVAFKKIPEKVTVNTAYTDNLGFEYTVTWKSGNTYSSNWPTAPSVTYTYEPTTSASEAKTEEVTVKWSCNGAEGEIKTNINVVTE